MWKIVGFLDEKFVVEEGGKPWGGGPLVIYTKIYQYFFP